MVLKDYERWAKINAYLMVGAVEFVRNSYMPKVEGSNILGDAMSFVRNVAIDLLDTSEYLKYNF